LEIVILPRKEEDLHARDLAVGEICEPARVLGVHRVHAQPEVPGQLAVEVGVDVVMLGLDRAKVGGGNACPSR